MAWNRVIRKRTHGPKSAPRDRRRNRFPLTAGDAHGRALGRAVAEGRTIRVYAVIREALFFEGFMKGKTYVLRSGRAKAPRGGVLVEVVRS